MDTDMLLHWVELFFSWFRDLGQAGIEMGLYRLVGEEIQAALDGPAVAGIVVSTVVAIVAATVLSSMGILVVVLDALTAPSLTAPWFYPLLKAEIVVGTVAIALVAHLRTEREIRELGAFEL